MHFNLGLALSLEKIVKMHLFFFTWMTVTLKYICCSYTAYCMHYWHSLSWFAGSSTHSVSLCVCACVRFTTADQLISASWSSSLFNVCAFRPVLSDCWCSQAVCFLDVFLSLRLHLDCLFQTGCPLWSLLCQETVAISTHDIWLLLFLLWWKFVLINCVFCICNWLLIISRDRTNWPEWIQQMLLIYGISCQATVPAWIVKRNKWLLQVAQVSELTSQLQHLETKTLCHPHSQFPRLQWRWAIRANPVYHLLHHIPVSPISVEHL